MSNFDFYMIDTIKDYADKLRSAENKGNPDMEWSLLNVLDELVHAYSEYKLNEVQ